MYSQLKRPGKMGWFPIRSRNEVLDTFIYSIAAAYYDNIFSWSAEEWSSYYFEIINPEEYGEDYR